MRGRQIGTLTSVLSRRGRGGESGLSRRLERGSDHLMPAVLGQRLVIVEA